MALRKFLFMSAEGYHQEQAAADEIQLGKLTLSGISGVALDGGGARLVNLGTPSAEDDAATKSYVDSVAQGLDIKESVRAVAVSNVSVNGTQTIDGVSLVDGNRVLLTGQTTPAQNGIWIVRAGSWERPTDFAPGGTAAGAFTFVEEGTALADSGWVCTSNTGADVIDTDPLAFTQFSGAGSIEAGDGLSKTGNRLDVVAGPGISVASDKVEVELDASSALEFHDGTDAGRLRWKPDTTRGLNRDASGAYVSLSATPGLQFNAGNLEAKINASGGLQKDAAGLAVKIDDTPDTLDVDADGLKVVGLPGQFKINGSAVSASVTATNLNELVGGGATSLHSHAASPTNRIEESMTVNENVALGDPVAMSATPNQVAKGNAATDAGSRIIGVATQAATAGNPATVVKRGTAVGILVGATPNTPYYLAAGGGLSSSVPGTGNRIILIGYARNATDLEVHIIDYGKR